eukprot:COSAG01_NODE_15964_length_1282_cov_1.962806_1_plen_137_part_00
MPAASPSSKGSLPLTPTPPSERGAAAAPPRPASASASAGGGGGGSQLPGVGSAIAYLAQSGIAVSDSEMADLITEKLARRVLEQQEQIRSLLSAAGHPHHPRLPSPRQPEQLLLMPGEGGSVPTSAAPRCAERMPE